MGGSRDGAAKLPLAGGLGMLNWSRICLAVLGLSPGLELPSTLMAQNRQAPPPAMPVPGAGRGFLGAMAGDVRGALRGAVIRAVRTNSPAQQAGLRPSDLVVAVDGRPVDSADELTGYVGAKHPGDRLAFTVLRWNGQSWQPLSLTATLGPPPAELLAPLPQIPTASAAPGLPTAGAGIAEAPARPAAPPVVSAAPLTVAEPSRLSDITWTSFSDPLERAFTVKIPEGWTVIGGTVRKTLLAPNFVLRLLSPDRQTFLAIGDPDAQNLRVPGQRDISAPGSATLVSSFPGARAIAGRYAELVLGKTCSGLRVTASTDRPELVETAAASDTPPNAQLTAAEASFTCQRGQRPMAGRSLAVLFYVNSPQHRADIWGLQTVAGFVTTPEQDEQARRLLGYVLGSLQKNPEWTAEGVEITRRSEQSALVRWAELERQLHAMDDLITGTAHSIGPGG